MRTPKPVVVGEATGCQMGRATRVPAGDAATRRGGARWRRAGSGGAVFWLVPRTGWLAVWMVMVVSLVAGAARIVVGGFSLSNLFGLRSVATAVRLESATDIPARLWTNMEQVYRS